MGWIDFTLNLFRERLIGKSLFCVGTCCYWTGSQIDFCCGHFYCHNNISLPGAWGGIHFEYPCDMNESHCSDFLSSPTFYHSHLIRLVYLGKGLGGFSFFSAVQIWPQIKKALVLNLFYNIFRKICLGLARVATSSALLSRVTWCGLIVWKDLVGSAATERNKLLRLKEWKS